MTIALLAIFNIILWTVGRETLIDMNKHSLGWAGAVVAGCFLVSLTSLILFA